MAKRKAEDVDNNSESEAAASSDEEVQEKKKKVKKTTEKKPKELKEPKVRVLTALGCQAGRFIDAKNRRNPRLRSRSRNLDQQGMKMKMRKLRVEGLRARCSRARVAKSTSRWGTCAGQRLLASKVRLPFPSYSLHS
jgi:hypothetical protein